MSLIKVLELILDDLRFPVQPDSASPWSGERFLCPVEMHGNIRASSTFHAIATSFASQFVSGKGGSRDNRPAAGGLRPSRPPGQVARRVHRRPTLRSGMIRNTRKPALQPRISSNSRTGLCAADFHSAERSGQKKKHVCGELRNQASHRRDHGST